MGTISFVSDATLNGAGGSSSGASTSFNLDLDEIDKTQKGYHEANGKFYYHLGSHHFVEADSRAELDEILAAASVSASVDLNHLTFFHLKNAALGTGLFDLDCETYGSAITIRVEPSYTVKVDSFNSKFFGDNMPTLGDAALMDPNNAMLDFELGWQGLSGQAERSAFIGTALYLYRHNYVLADTPGINEGNATDASSLTAPLDPNSLNADTLGLIRHLFGASVQPNQGHLNILKMLGCVGFDANVNDLSSWTLNNSGQEALRGMDANPTNLFIPSNTLHAMMGSTVATAESSKSNFSTDGRSYRTGFGIDSTRQAATSILSALNLLGTPEIPVALSYPGRTTNMLNALFNKTAGNTQFTSNEINTAISMGLLHYDGTGSVQMTLQGSTFLTATDPATANPPPITDTLPNASPRPTNDAQQLYDAIYVFTHGGGIQYADKVDNEGNQSDNIFVQYAIDGLANANVDSHYFDRAGLSHLTHEQRQGLINAAQTIRRLGGTWDSGGVMQALNNGGGYREEEFTNWLQNNRNNFYSDITLHFNEGVVPADFVFDEANSRMTDNTRSRLNTTCQALFGRSFDAMSTEERRRAVFVLSQAGFFTYQPPTYETVYDLATGQTTLNVISKGNLYMAPSTRYPGGDPVLDYGIHPPGWEEEQEEEEDYDSSYWYGGS